MNEAREKIYEDINEERDHQDERWGNDFDDGNSVADFQQYINNQFTRGFSYTGDLRDDPRTALVKAAAVAVGMLETWDRNNGIPSRM